MRKYLTLVGLRDRSLTIVDVFDGERYWTSRVVVVYVPGAFCPKELPGREILCWRSSNMYSEKKRKLNT